MSAIIKMYRNYTVCVQVPYLHPGANLHPMQINLHHLEGRSKFGPGCKFAPGSKFLKHRSHGQKYTPGANLHPGCKFAPGVQIVHMNEASSIDGVTPVKNSHRP